MNSCNDGTEPLGEAPDLPGRTPPAGTDRPIVFLDTETLSLDSRAPIWEFAAIRVEPDGETETISFQIRHEPGDWVKTLPEWFQEDYQHRYSRATAIGSFEAAVRIGQITHGAIVVGCNPGFDLDSGRLEELLSRHGFTPAWHYHPLDTAAMALAWLWGRGVRPPQPWKSDELSRLIGVDPAQFDRHTAIGDVLWCHAQWTKMQAAPNLAASVRLA